MESIPSIVLNTGARMPILGLGTWKSTGSKVGQAVKCAILETGYKHIDCAYIYGNEKEIGETFEKIFSDGKIGRQDVFVTSKLWNSFHSTKDVEKACKKTLSDLKLDYLDLYLMHWGIAEEAGPGEERLDEKGYLLTENISLQETWHAMESLFHSGLVRAIGISNFTAPMILDLLSYAKVVPAMNQIELHPYLQQQELVDFCRYKNIAVTAYSPLGSPGNSEGKPKLLDDKILGDIAKSHRKTSAQIALRWGIQRGTVVIPKSTTPENIKENINVFDFELSDEEMGRIKKLEKKFRYVNPGEWWKFPYFD